MKKNDLILLIAVLLYSYLFYNQTAGINFLIYTVTLVVGLVVRNPSVIKSASWQAAAIGSLLSGICVFLYGNTLSVIANILSLSVTAVYSSSRDSSLIFAILYSIYSYLSSLVFMILELIERKTNNSPQPERSYLKLLISIVPVLITVAFFMLYREGNPLFKKVTENINLDFINLDWIRFTFFGFILLYGFFKIRIVAELNILDKLGFDTLTKSSETIPDKMVQNENFSGVLLFGLLNILLLFVNFVDLNYLFLAQLPEGFTYSELVHQGIYTLIASLVFAIATILFYFRGNLNFYQKNGWIKWLAYAWIFQNIVLILITVFKNNMYVEEYSLTYKRIGVYIYLLAALIGLVTTFIKILTVKSNWFLFRKNSWAFYCVLILSCFINWDLLISRFNINHSKNLDKQYLLGLSDTVIPDLAAIKYEEFTPEDERHIHILNKKKEEFIQEYKAQEWQSWNLEDERIYNSLNK